MTSSPMKASQSKLGRELNFGMIAVSIVVGGQEAPLHSTFWREDKREVAGHIESYPNKPFSIFIKHRTDVFGPEPLELTTFVDGQLRDVRVLGCNSPACDFCPSPKTSQPPSSGTCARRDAGDCSLRTECQTVVDGFSFLDTGLPGDAAYEEWRISTMGYGSIQVKARRLDLHEGKDARPGKTPGSAWGGLGFESTPHTFVFWYRSERYLRAQGVYNDAIPAQPSLVAYPSSAWVAPRNEWSLQDAAPSLHVSEAAFIDASDADADDILFTEGGDSDDDDPPYAERMIVTTP